MTYADQLKSPLWQKKRKIILDRDEHKCRECGTSGTKLDIHHGYYEKGSMAWEYDDKYLHTLCERCHGDYHIFLKKLMQLSGEMLPTVIQYLYQILAVLNSKAKGEWYDISDVTCYTNWIIDSIQQINPIKEEDTDGWLD